MDSQLHAFLNAMASGPFEWGVNDCCASVDAWAVARGHNSPISAVGEKYDDAESARAIIEKYHGVPRMVATAMRAAKIPRTKAPRCGDVGVVVMLGRVCAAINVGGMWVSRDEGGVMASSKPDRVIAAWGIK